MAWEAVPIHDLHHTPAAYIYSFLNKINQSPLGAGRHAIVESGDHSPSSNDAGLNAAYDKRDPWLYKYDACSAVDP